MKQLSGLLVLTTALFVQSCLTKRIADNNQALTDQHTNPQSSVCYVEYNDDNIQYFTTLTLVKGITKAPHLLGDGKVKINAKHIKAYQNKQHYAISQKVYKPKRLSYVAIETLPGFAVQIAKGKLNIYARKSYDSNKAIEEYFIQTGTNPIKEYSDAYMFEVIRENTQAAEFFNNQKYKAARPILKETASLFNNAASITRNK